MTPIQSLRYLQGYAWGDGWINCRFGRFKVFVYDPIFATKIRRMMEQVKHEFDLSGWESRKKGRFTGTCEWRFEIGKPTAVMGLNLSLLKSPEGQHFLAGLWDADGGWHHSDESHPFGQARIWGRWHTVYRVKHVLRHQWGIATGRMSITTRAGYTSRIGDHTIVARRNVYGAGVLARSMKEWVDLVGNKMMLKRQAIQE